MNWITEVWGQPPLGGVRYCLEVRQEYLQGIRKMARRDDQDSSFFNREASAFCMA